MATLTTFSSGSQSTLIDLDKMIAYTQPYSDPFPYAYDIYVDGGKTSLLATDIETAQRYNSILQKKASSGLASWNVSSHLTFDMMSVRAIGPARKMPSDGSNPNALPMYEFDLHLPHTVATISMKSNQADPRSYVIEQVMKAQTCQSYGIEVVNLTNPNSEILPGDALAMKVAVLTNPGHPLPGAYVDLHMTGPGNYDKTLTMGPTSDIGWAPQQEFMTVTNDTPKGQYYIKVTGIKAKYPWKQVYFGLHGFYIH